MLSQLYWQGPISYEPVTVKTWWCLSRDAAAVIDVGAHVGYYALLASNASATARIDAFEPLTEAAALMRTSADLNGCTDRLHVHETALGSRMGEADFYLPTEPANPLPTVGFTASRFSDREQSVRRTVEMTTLDSVVASTGRGCDLIKLDAEGAELDVLVGAQQTVERFEPDIILEIVLTGCETPETVSWLVERGYRIFDLTPDGPVSVDIRELAGMFNLRDSASHRYGELLATTKPDQDVTKLAQCIADLHWPG